ATIGIATAPSNGSLIDNLDGTVTYAHDGSETVSDTFQYRVQDDDAAYTDIATVTITITPVNDDPVAYDDSGSLSEGGSTAIDLTDNDTDIDGTIDDTTVDITTAPTNGTLVDNDDGTVTYTHDGSETTDDTFQYRVMDDDGAYSNSAAVTIVIAEVNDDPVANDDSGTVDEGDSVIVNLTGNDTDIDGTIDNATIGIATAPSNGSLIDNLDGTVTYTHDGSENFSDTFQYRVMDDDSAFTNIATVTITITEVNDAPVVTQPDDQTDYVAESPNLPVIGSDTDGPSTIWSATGLPDGLNINSSTGVISGTLTASGAFTVIVTLRDGGAPEESDSKTFNWTVHVHPNVIDLTPTTGTLVEGDPPSYANKGYQFVADKTFTINGGRWWIDMPSGGVVRMSIYDSGGTLLAQGSTAVGNGTEQWYVSDLTYTFNVGTTYTVSFYTDKATTALMDRKDGPTQPFSVSPYVSQVKSRSSSSQTNEEYPDYLGNSWAPLQQLIFPVLDVGAQVATYDGSPRGYYFTAPVDFRIVQLHVPTDFSSEPQVIQVVRCAGIPTSGYTNFVTLFHQANIAGDAWTDVDIPVSAGEVIAVIGGRGTSTIYNSYGPSGYVSSIFGNPVTLNRIWNNSDDINAGPVDDINYESGRIGRIEFAYAE
ncbi:MAG: tandem-95 repeat protein, partial [Proteobacteria bacterium]|nr:tandem-95 repeat protein [Pseudomonadota bacterium]